LVVVGIQEPLELLDASLGRPGLEGHQ
jgi:hypothetical protein